jgi:hypothetical protein
MPLLVTVAILLSMERMAAAGVVPIKVKARKKMRQGRGTAMLHGAGNERRDRRHDSLHDALMHDTTRRK